MGLKHLKQIEEFLRTHPGEGFTKTEIRDALSINYHTVLEVMEYLLESKKIKISKKIGDFERLSWNE